MDGTQTQEHTEEAGSPAEPANRGRDWRHDAEVFGQKARVFVAENPLAALGIALTAGFVVGRIVRRIS